MSSASLVVVAVVVVGGGGDSTLFVKPIDMYAFQELSSVRALT